jgi:alpha-tubulin suppressor-like RCC1 family protein
MLKSQDLINKICTRINAGGMSALQACQTNNALIFLNSCPVASVANNSTLPNVNDNIGRLIYVSNEKKYYYGTEYGWKADLDSCLETFATAAYAWGRNIDGVLGIGTTNTNIIQENVIPGNNNWLCVDHCGTALGIDTSNRLWAWGGGTTIGDNDSIKDRSSPVLVAGGFTDWCNISAGCNVSAGIRTNGTLWVWGNQSYTGLLGLDSNLIERRSSPVQVCGGFTDWCQVSISQQHAGAVRTNGSLWVWGCNFSGQLGDNTVSTRSSPVQVCGGFSDWCQVATSSNHTTAIRTNGTLWAWGCNIRGQLGDDTVVSKSSPVSVVGGFTNWCCVDIASGITGAVRTDGTLWAWGCNICGGLGDGTVVCRSSPVSVVGGFTDWCTVSLETLTMMGIRTNGTLWLWGNIQCGIDKNTTLGRRSSPVQVDSFTNWTSISMNSSSAIGIRNVCKGF